MSASSTLSDNKLLFRANPFEDNASIEATPNQLALAGALGVAPVNVTNVANIAGQTGNFTTSVSAPTGTFSTNVVTPDLIRPVLGNTANVYSTGTGDVNLGPNIVSTSFHNLIFEDTSVDAKLFSLKSVVSQSAGSNQVITTNAFVNGVYLRNCNGGLRLDSSPTAADILADIPGAVIGSTFEFTVVNTSDPSLNDEFLVIAPGSGVEIKGDRTVIECGLRRTSSWFGVVTNTAPATVAMYRVLSPAVSLIQATFVNASSGPNAVTFAQWGRISQATVDCTVLGVHGYVSYVECVYGGNAAIGIDAGELMSFSIGSVDNTNSVFTAYPSGLNIIVWSNADNGTYPATSSGPLSNITIEPTTRLALRSVELGSVTPATMEVRVTVGICIL